MLVSLAKALGIFFLAQTVIFAGILFISGQLLPNALAAVYSQTNYAARLILSLISAFAAGNLLMAYGYGHFNPGIAAPVSIFCTVLVQIFAAVMILGVRPPWLLLPATLIVAGGCVWVIWLLTRA